MSEHADRVDRYDAVTIGFHWLTVVLVAVLFGMTLWWEYAPHAVRFRFELEDAHVGIGLGFAAVILARLVWRVVRTGRLPAGETGMIGVLARAVHQALYVLLFAQLASGVLLSGYQGGELAFFGLFTLPPVVEPARDMAELLEGTHDIAAWALVILAAGHAVMALVHHYLMHDGVLRRMLPTR